MRVWVDIALAVLWGGIVVYFWRRFSLYRRWTSAALAVSAVGWMCIGLYDRLQGRLHLNARDFAVFKVAAALTGLFLWVSIYKVERTRRDKGIRQ